jgi:hypothetical protein
LERRSGGVSDMAHHYLFKANVLRMEQK